MNGLRNIRDSPPIADALALLIDGATNYAIYMLDPDGLVAIWNRGAERIKGWAEHEIVGQPARLFYLPEDIAAGKPEDELARATQFGRVEEESWRVRKDGSVFLANVTITALYAQSGELRGFGKVVRDITEQRAAEAALAHREAQLTAILATVPDATIVLDAEFRIMSFSRTAERVFGYTETEVLGRHAGDLLTSGIYADIFEKGPLPVEGSRLVGRRHDGSGFPLELALDRMNTGGAGTFVAFVRDLTERERTIDELQRLQTKLAKVARVSLLGAMGTTLAHELNQPITAVVNYAEAVRDQIATGAAPALIDETIEGVVSESLRAGEIVRQLRSFIKRGELDKHPCDLAALIQESCNILTSAIAEHGIALRLDFDHGDRPVFVERIQVQQVIINLLRNAIEAMMHQNHRTLTIRTSRAKRMVRVSVSDTGHGFAEAITATLFDTFFSGKADGMGVGLSICQTIVEAHGGKIWALTEDGQTCFHFTLPTINSRD